MLTAFFCCFLLAALPLASAAADKESPATPPVAAGEAAAGNELPGAAAEQDENAPSSAPDVPATAPFRFADVEKKARELAAAAFESPDAQVPEYLLRLSGRQWNRISFKPDHTLWKDEGLPFAVQLFHPGFIYNRVTPLHVVDARGSTRLAFSSDMFNYGDDALTERSRKEQLDFAGFRLHFPINRQDVMDEIAVFLGATYFRGLGKNTEYGMAARGLTVNTALPEGEERPYFREYWLVKPEPDAVSFTVYALMDSPSLTGAYRFIITPGTSTVMNVSSTLFLRKGAQQPAKIGLAPLTSMFLYSETTNGSRNDYRPEVHNSDGLLSTADENTWVWRPLSNPERLAINSFAMENPRGFGLMQRDDSFEHYQDFNARYELSPSVWIAPQKDWGAGRLELVEIPSKEDIHDNIMAYWVPDAPVTAPGPGQNTEPGADAPFMACAYTLYWMAPNVTPHSLGRAVATRMVRSPDEGTVRFIIDFESEALNTLPADTGLSSIVETPEASQLLEKQLDKNPVTGGWRLQFKARLPQTEGVMQSILAARAALPQLRFRAMLKKGENLPDPLTEVWVYDIPF